MTGPETREKGRTMRLEIKLECFDDQKGIVDENGIEWELTGNLGRRDHMQWTEVTVITDRQTNHEIKGWCDQYKRITIDDPETMAYYLRYIV